MKSEQRHQRRVACESGYLRIILSGIKQQQQQQQNTHQSCPTARFNFQWKYSTTFNHFPPQKINHLEKRETVMVRVRA